MNDYLDTHTAIVGASGAGKTVTAKWLVETLLDAGRHTCIVDPTGAWWGLRSAANGIGPGFDIPIFGGAHGDVPVTADQGDAVGSIIAGGVSGIIDISSLRTGSEQRRFVRDLCRRLRAKPDGNFHLIVDEADDYCPQRPRDDYGFQVGEELAWMAKRGRLPGFVLALVTQRPASIDKEVLTQAQTLIVHQMLAPVDQKPVLEYLRDHADRASLATIRASLASLDRGERWIYSPRAGVLERGFTPLPRTFDSSRTPAPGERVAEPKMLAGIDLAEIRKALAGVTDSGNARLNMSDIMPGTAEAADADWVIERAVAQRQLDELSAEIVQLRKDIGFWKQIADGRIKMIRDARAALADNEITSEAAEVEPVKGAGREVEDKPSPHSRSKGSLRPASRKAGPPATLQSDSIARPGPTRDAPAPALNASARKMIEMLDRIAPASVPWGSLATMIGNKARGGNFNAARKAMRESGLIVEDGNTVRSATAAGGGLRWGQVFALWQGVLSNPAPRMMIALKEEGPLSKDALGANLGIVPRGGNFNNGVAQLIRNGVAIDQGGVLRLADPLPGEWA